MKALELVDSQYIDSKQYKAGDTTAFYCQAVDKLNNDLKDRKVEFFSLGGVANDIEDTLIWYEIGSTRDPRGYAVIDKATFYTSHYIGFYSTKISNKNINISVEPRFGNGIFNYLLSYTYGIYLPKGLSSTSSKKSDSLWLIAIMWKATLQKAMTKSQIPKEYQKFEKNLSTYKGQINISKHIKHNLFDKSKFYCNYRKLSMDTAINQTIRYIYKLLKNKGYDSLLKDIAEYDQMLGSFGVRAKSIHIQEIQKIRYSKLNIYYKKVMELSSLIVKSQSKSSDCTSSSNDSFSYFLNIAELWENYLLKLLQRNFPEYNIYSPNEEGGEYLIEDSFRQIRPDIVIKKDGKVIAILDAKYKNYNKIGKYGNSAKNPNFVSRDDLYQMSTYLYHYSNQEDCIAGLFISPVEDCSDENNMAVKAYANNFDHKIGVINLNIKQFDKKYDESNTGIELKDTFSNNKIEEEEKKFIEKIKAILALVVGSNFQDLQAPKNGALNSKKMP